MEHNYLTQAPLKLFTAADVEPKEVRWLWYPYIPLGKVTLVHGDSGDGKSTFALNLAALLTRGDVLPFSSQCHGPMNVICVLSSTFPQFQLRKFPSFGLGNSPVSARPY